MDKIVLKNMEFRGRIGCLEQEKETYAPYKVTVSLYIGHIKGADTDELADTVDYSEVYEIARSVIEEEPMNLIEYAAGQIADRILEKFDEVENIKVTVSKPEAPIDGVFETMEVTIER